MYTISSLYRLKTVTDHPGGDVGKLKNLSLYNNVVGLNFGDGVIGFE